MPPPSPWANKTLAPFQAAAALIPLVDTKHGPVFHDELHGTAFFISDGGLFLTAAHVIEAFPNYSPPLQLVIFNAYGVQYMPVAFTTRHPTADVALGMAVVDQDHPAKVSPMVLSSRRLTADEDVAVFGYPRNETQHALNSQGDALSRITVHGDYFEGRILEHHPEGVGLAARGAAYSTSIVPPPPFKDFAGMSGGPLVASDTLHVHGMLSSGSESYSICSDIETVLEWEVFKHDSAGSMTLRQFTGRYPGLIRIAS